MCVCVCVCHTSSIPSCKWGPGLGWGWTRPLAMPQPTEVQVGLRLPIPRWWHRPCFCEHLAQLYIRIFVVQALRFFKWHQGSQVLATSGVWPWMADIPLLICPFILFCFVLYVCVRVWGVGAYMCVYSYSWTNSVVVCFYIDERSPYKFFHSVPSNSTPKVKAVVFLLHFLEMCWSTWTALGKAQSNLLV